RSKAALSEGVREEQPAVGPLPVKSPGDTERAQVALEDLGVVAHSLDDADGPVVVEVEHRAEAAFCAKEPVDLRSVAFYTRDVVLRDAVLPGKDGSEDHPGDEVVPLVVALARRLP